MHDLHPGIEEYLSRLEPWQQKLYYELRKLILSLHPMMEEHFLYKTPFYKLNGLFCYFTVLQKGNRTVLGICDGHLITDSGGLLKADDHQKQVRHIVFSENERADFNLISEILLEAVFLKTDIIKK